MNDLGTTLEVLPMAEEWFSQDDLMARWKVSKTTIRRLRQAGKLPAFQITNSLYRFKLSDVLRLEREGRLLPAIVPQRKRKRKNDKGEKA